MAIFATFRPRSSMDRIPACRQAGKFPEFEFMFYWVYAIQSGQDGRIYVGFSKDVDVRLRQHNSGKTKSTKGFKPWKLIYSEKVEGRLETREREKYYKSGSGKEFLKSLPAYKAP